MSRAARDPFEEGALMAGLNINAMGHEIVDSGIALQCPGCRSGLSRLECVSCGFQMQLCDGIVHALLPESGAHYSQFVDDYERIRSREGRGSRNENFYLGLPYVDTSGTKLQAVGHSGSQLQMFDRRCSEAAKTRWTDPGSWRRQRLDEFSPRARRISSCGGGPTHK